MRGPAKAPDKVRPMPDARQDSSLKPCFITGVPRSGTTLLQLILATHPGLFSLPETHLFTYVFRRLPKTAETRLDAAMAKRILTLLAEKPGIEVREGREAFLAHAASGPRLPEALDALIRIIADERGGQAEAWIEKTPRHLFHSATLEALFPQARFIHIVRDPRCTASSIAHRYDDTPARGGISERTAHILRSAAVWKAAMAHSAGLDPDRWLTLRYEDLVNAQAPTLERVCAHLGIAPSELSLDQFAANYGNCTVPKENGHKAMCAESEIVDRRHVWKDRMSEDQAWAVETLCAEGMVRHGYEPARPADYRLPLSWRLFAWRALRKKSDYLY